MIWFYLLLALAAGAILPVQAGVNAQLARAVGHPLLAALISFAIGTGALSLYTLIARPVWPGAAALQQSPWWVWVGGVLGAFFVTGAIYLIPRLGASLYVALVIAGQTLISAAIDHYGLLGFEVRPMNVWRGAGAVLLLIGVELIRRF